MTRVEVENLNICFPIYHGDSRALKRWMVSSIVKGNEGGPSQHLRQDARQRVTVQVLEQIRFHLSPGDRLGLVGCNGAGKTTLLRALCGIYEPISGRVVIEGRLGTLLDASLGMNEELSGAENIRLRCLFYGTGRKAYRKVVEDVTAFAELGDFINLPVKTYSSGMRVRLAFGLATAIVPQILLMDEWLMAGDIGFMERAQARLEALVATCEIFVVSSHQPEILRRWCNRLIWLENGRIKMDGTTQDVLDAYLNA